MKDLLRKAAAILAVTLTVGPVLFASAPESAEIQALQNQIRVLEDQIRTLARRIETRDETAVASAPKAAVDRVAPAVPNPIKLGSLVQLDGRQFFHEGSGVANNSFLLRRARLLSEGRLAENYGFQLVADFGGSSVVVQDANFTVAVDRSLQFRFGKFKSPVGLEQVQSDARTFFNERSLVTNLVPNRDLGIVACGEVGEGTLSYQFGVMNGVGDGASTTNVDFDNEKEAVARVMVTPFKQVSESLMRGLSFGLAATLGREKGALGRTAGYKSDGQQTFFSYNAATVADGRTTRVSPQFDFRLGSFGAIGEYVVSIVNVRAGAAGAKRRLSNRAWQFSAGYVLTGEESSYLGVTPRTGFDWAAGTWGAFEIVARCASLQVDDAAFPLYAAVANNADRAHSSGLGLNWYLSRAVAFKFDGFQTRFGSAPQPAGAPFLRPDERVFVTRFQFAF